VTVDQLAYLKSPDKIRAALINAGKRAPSVDVIARRLAQKSGPHRVDEPLPSDDVEYRVPRAKRTVVEGADVYMRAYHFPKAVMNLKRKMDALEAEAQQVGAAEYLKCLKAANAAWEREVEIARLQDEVRRGGGK
jgi:hypothetical protein